jgi:hypothetical protein
MVVESTTARAEGPSLTDTLEWIDSTYNSHQGEGGAFGHGVEEVFTNGKLFKRRTARFTYDGCQIKLYTQDDPASPLYSDLYTSTVYTINLQDVDPTSIKLYSLDSQHGGLSCDIDPQHMTCDIVELEFETPNQAPLFEEHFHAVYPKLRGSEHDATHDGKTFVAMFYLDDVEYSARFTKAFRHAVALCGGKRSPF